MMFKFSILMVDDNLTLLQMVSAVLERAGYRVVQATNGEEAVKIALDQQPQVILLDDILPGMDGYEVCRQLKSLPETELIPVVMMTSWDVDVHPNQGTEQGPDTVIVRPFELQTLLNIIRQYET